MKPMTLTTSLVVGIAADVARDLRDANPSPASKALSGILSRFHFTLSSFQWEPPSAESVQYAHLDLAGTASPLQLQEALLQLPFVLSAFIKPPGEEPSAEGPPG